MSKLALYNAAKRATRKQPAAETLRNAANGQPTRYIFTRRKLKGKKGMTKRRYLIPVEFGDPRYEDAPYEIAVFVTTSTSA